MLREKKHISPLVVIVEGVMHQIPLSCGKKYIGQKGRCLNDRLRVHSLNFNNYQDGDLYVHCQYCGCKPLLNTCTVHTRLKDKAARDIIKADVIERSGACYVNIASIDLTDNKKLS